MKNVKYKAAVLFLSVTLLTGCGQESQNIVVNEEEEQGVPQTELTFFGYKYEALNVEAIEKALHGFMDAHPDVTISYDGIKGLEYFDVLQKRLDSGNADDIFMVDQAMAQKLEKEHKLADLSNLSCMSEFSQLAKSQMSAGGEICYLPTSISAFGLYCNEDLLKEHGQKIPQNLSEFTGVCDYFVSRGITPIVANNDISLKTVAIAKGMLPFYQKENPAEEITRLNEDSTALTEALRPGFVFVEEMLKKGWVNREEALKTEKTKDDLTLFAKGEQPFMLTGVWAVPRLRNLHPAFSFTVEPYPILEEGGVLVINVDTRISVLADSPNLEESMEFAEYMMKPEINWEFVDSQCSFSPLKENRLAEDEAIQSIGPYLTNGCSVIGSDDNFTFSIWNNTRQCIVGMLEGDDAEAAVLRLTELTEADRTEGGEAAY